MHYSIARILFGIPNQKEPLLSIFLKLPASHLFDEVSRSGNLKDNAVHFHQQSEIKFSLKREILLFGSFCFDPSFIWLYFFRDGLGGCYLGIATALLISNHSSSCMWLIPIRLSLGGLGYLFTSIHLFLFLFIPLFVLLCFFQETIQGRNSIKLSQGGVGWGLNLAISLHFNSCFSCKIKTSLNGVFFQDGIFNKTFCVKKQTPGANVFV